MGVVLSMVSKMRGPKRFNFVPTLLGMALYKNGCSSSVSMSRESKTVSITNIDFLYAGVLIVLQELQSTR